MGTKIKLQLAAALAHHPKLLILDEPTSGLDPIARDELIAILQDFIRDEQHSVLISTHSIMELAKVRIMSLICWLVKSRSLVHSAISLTAIF